MITIYNYVVGQEVNHKIFGAGTVVCVEPRTFCGHADQPIVEVQFGEVVRRFNGESLHLTSC